MSDSTKTPAAVAVPTSGSATDAVAATPMKGGALLSPLPLTGGRRGRKTRRMSKKAMKMLKKMTPKQLKKMLKGGEEPAAVEATEMEGARRRSRKGGRKSRKSRRGLLY